MKWILFCLLFWLSTSSAMSQDALPFDTLLERTFLTLTKQNVLKAGMVQMEEITSRIDSEAAHLSASYARYIFLRSYVQANTKRNDEAITGYIIARDIQEGLLGKSHEHYDQTVYWLARLYLELTRYEENAQKPENLFLNSVQAIAPDLADSFIFPAINHILSSSCF